MKGITLLEDSKIMTNWVLDIGFEINMITRSISKKAWKFKMLGIYDLGGLE